jgi:leader peptidase (prepilin peptidase)/N-methyltransferase
VDVEPLTWRQLSRPRRAVVLLACAGASALMLWRVGTRPELSAFLLLGCVGTVLALVDAATLRLPDRLLLPLAAGGAVGLGAAALASDRPHAAVRALLGALLFGGCTLLAAVARPGAFGLGDVKLCCVLGGYLGWLGWSRWITGVGAALALAGVAAAVLLVAGRVRRLDPLPLGPFLVAGTLLAIAAP